MVNPTREREREMRGISHLHYVDDGRRAEEESTHLKNDRDASEAARYRATGESSAI